MKKIYYFIVSEYGHINKEFRTKKSLDKFIKGRQSIVKIAAYKVEKKLVYKGMFYWTKTKINKVKFK